MQNEVTNNVMASIIIPTYKGSHTVLLAVESALSQTIKNKEVIVIDDNGVGTEEQINTEKVLNKYIVNNAIQYICHKENKNGSAARNTGLNIAKGRYINFVDDDDYLMPNKIEMQLKCVESNNDENIGMCVCEGFYVDTNGKGFIGKNNYLDNCLYYYLCDKNYFNTTAILFDTNKLKNIHGFDDSFRRHQDWELCVRFLSQYTMCAVKQPLIIRYIEGRNNPSSIDSRINYLNYFFDHRMSFLETTLSKKQINRIVILKCRKNCQIMIKNMHFKMALEYGKSYNNVSECIVAFIDMIFIAIRKIVFRSRKITYTKKELMNMILKDTDYKCA